MPVNELNDEIKNLLNEFCEEFVMPRILDKDNLLAILTYGSSLTGYSSKNSDIDLLIILNEAEETIRGVKHYKGKKIEYFIKPIEKFLSESVSYTKSNCPSHVAMEQNAYFLYDRFGFFANILKADTQFYNKNREKPKMNLDLKFVQIENRLASLKNIYERDGVEFHSVYFNILELIRQFHTLRSEEAEIPFSKVYRIYTDDDYYDRFVSKNASNPYPDKEFVRLYKKCVEEFDHKDKMLSNIQNLYNYEKQFVKINVEDFEIKL